MKWLNKLANPIGAIIVSFCMMIVTVGGAYLQPDQTLRGIIISGSLIVLLIWIYAVGRYWNRRH